MTILVGRPRKPRPEGEEANKTVAGRSENKKPAAKKHVAKPKMQTKSKTVAKPKEQMLSKTGAPVSELDNVQPKFKE